MHGTEPRGHSSVYVKTNQRVAVSVCEHAAQFREQACSHGSNVRLAMWARVIHDRVTWLKMLPSRTAMAARGDRAVVTDPAGR